MKNFDLFRLEDRILFDAAGAVDIVETLNQVEQNPVEQNAANEQEEKEHNAVKNAPPENPAEQFSLPGKPMADPGEAGNVDFQINALLEGDLPDTSDINVNDDNIEENRFAGLFSASGAVETPSLVVTTNQDIVDNSDGFISLREALKYAANGTRDEAGSCTITFSNSVTHAIQLNDTLTIEDNIFSGIDRLTINGKISATDNVNISGNASVQILTIGANNDVTIENTTFINGDTTENGGAIYSQGNLIIKESVFSNNKATLNGGAIAAEGNLIISQSTFLDNSSGDMGGAVYVINDAVIENSTFIKNKATLEGGALGSAYGSHVEIINSTFYNNKLSAESDKGGALSLHGDSRLLNVTAVGNRNSSSSPNDIYNDGPTSAYYSLFEKVEGSDFTEATGTQNGLSLNDVYGTVFPIERVAGDQHYLELSVQYRPPSADGVFVWRDTTWDNIAYSTDLAGNNKTAIKGDADNATARLEFDQINNPINKPLACIGSFYAPVEKPSLIVNTNADSSDKSDGLISLREAIEYASLSQFTDKTIKFDSGVFTNYENSTITLTNELLISDNIFTEIALTIDGNISDFVKLTLDGNSSNRILNIGANNKVTLSNLTFTNGQQDSSEGGAIYAGTGSSLSISNSVFSGNSANNGGAISNVGRLTIRNVNFRDNVATSAGGAIFNNGTIDITDTNFRGNSAKDGGAINNCATLNVTDSLFEENSATNSGGAINNMSSGVATLIYAEIYDNEANAGGAIANKSYMTVVNSVLNGNEAVTGSDGVFSSNGDFVIVNSILVGNGTSDLTVSGGEFHSYYTIYSATGADLGSAAVNKNIITTAAVLDDNREIIRTSVAGFSGTVVGAKGGTIYFFDTAERLWRKLENTSVEVDFWVERLNYAMDVIYSKTAYDPFRLFVDTGIAEFASTTPNFEKIYINVTQNSGIVEYDGKTHITNLVYTTASGKTISESLVSGIITGQTSSANAGTYTINAYIAENAGINGKNSYEFIVGADAILEITQKVLSIDESNFVINAKEYDGTTAGKATFNWATGDIVEDDTVSLSFNATLDSKNVNEVRSVTLSDFSIDNSNYKLVSIAPIVVAKDNLIYAKEVTPEVIAHDKEYDGTADASFDVLYLDGVLEADEFNLRLECSASFSDKNAANDKEVTITYDGLSGTARSNYRLATNEMIVYCAIRPRLLAHDITVDSSKIYDGTTSASYTGNFTNVVDGDDIQFDIKFNYNSANVLDANTITGEYSWNGADSGNYQFSGFAPMAGTITQRDIAILPAMFTIGRKEYDGKLDFTDHINADLSGYIIPGDEVAMNFTATLNSKDVATARIVTITDFSIDNDNYTIGSTSSITINQSDIVYARSVNVSGITAQNKVYDGNTHAEFDCSNVNFAGIIADDELTVTANGMFDDINAGSGKTVTLSGLTLGGADKANYLLSESGQQNTATADIYQLKLTHNVSVETVKIYDGNDNSVFTGGITNVIAGDEVALNAEFRYNSSNVTEACQINAAVWNIYGADSGNYVLEDFITVDGRITPRDITITADDLTVVQGTTPEFTYQLAEPLLADNAVSGELYADKVNIPGKHTIEQGTLDIPGGNYNIMFIPGILTVEAAPAPANPDADSSSNTASALPAMSAAFNTLPNTKGAVNPFTMSYSELVSLELNNRENSYAVSQSDFQLGTNSNFRHMSSDIFNGTERTVMRERAFDESGNFVSQDYIAAPVAFPARADVVWNTVIGKLGFFTGDEIFVKNKDFYPDRTNPDVEIGQNILVSSLSYENNTELPEGYDVDFSPVDIPEKAGNLKSELEKLLDEMVKLA